MTGKMKTWVRSAALLVLGCICGWLYGAFNSGFYIPFSNERIQGYELEIPITHGRAGLKTTVPRGDYRWFIQDANGARVEPKKAGLEIRVIVGKDEIAGAGSTTVADFKFNPIEVIVTPLESHEVLGPRTLFLKFGSINQYTRVDQ